MHSNLAVKEVTHRPDTQLDPISLRKIFLRLLRNHYADPNNFGDVPEAFKQFKYSEEPKERTLNIDLDYHYDNFQLEYGPMLFVGLGDFDFSKQIMNNTTGNTVDNSGTNYDNLVRTNLIVQHINLTPDEALMLGTITTAFLRGIRSTIMSSLDLVQFDVMKLSRVQQDDKTADKAFISTLTSTLAFHSTWTTYIESHRIKKVNYSV